MTTDGTPKPWWEGDSRVEPYMVPVREVLVRHIPYDHKSLNRELAEIYNCCYMAVYQAITDAEKEHNCRNVKAIT